MRRSAALLVVMSVVILLTASSALAAPKPWELINWNAPVPWPERLLADKYILPEGWEEALEGVTEITYYNSGSLDGDIATAMNIRRFEELTGIKVNAIPVAADLAYVKGVSTLIARDRSVDAVLSNDPQFDMAAFVAAGWITPVDHMFPPEVQELYNPNLYQALGWGGHWWALPVCTLGHLEFYRPSWLAAAGVEVPQTWDEYGDAVRRVGQWARSTFGPDYYGSVYVGGSQDILNQYLSMIWSQGAKLFDEGRYQFESPASRRAFSLMVDLVKEGYVPADVVNYAWGDVGTFFGTGKAGFMSAMQPSFYTVYRTQYPQLQGDFAMYAPPKWSADDPDEWIGRGLIGNNSMLINDAADDRRKAAVMLFFDFIRSREGQRNEVIVEGNESLLLAIWDDPDSEIDKVDWDLANRVADELGIPRVTRPESVPGVEVRRLNMERGVFEVFPPGFPEILRTFIAQFGEAATGRITVDQALKAIQSVADELTP